MCMSSRKAAFLLPGIPGEREKVLLMDLLTMIGQVSINPYVVIGCCIVGWLMKKFLPTDNRIIPLVLTLLGAALFVMIESLSVENAITGAFLGSAATGLHQIYKQYVEGKDLAATNGDGSRAEDINTETEYDEEVEI